METVCANCKWVTGTDHIGGNGWRCLNPLNDDAGGFLGERRAKRVFDRFKDNCRRFEAEEDLPDAILKSTRETT